MEVSAQFSCFRPRAPRNQPCKIRKCPYSQAMPAAQPVEGASRLKLRSSTHVPAASSNGSTHQPSSPLVPGKELMSNGSTNGGQAVTSLQDRTSNGNGKAAHYEQTNGHGHLVTRRSAPFTWDQMTVLNKAQLCAYPDCLGKNLEDLRSFMGHPELQGAIHGLHLLPVYNSTSDRGFAPKNYTEVDPKFGTWEDVESLAASHDLTLDLMANHIGRASDEFQDFKHKGRASKFYDLFIHWKDVFDGVGPTSKELDMVYTRKPAFPYIDIEHDDGTTSRIWNTFGEDQFDINPDTQLGREYICGNIARLAQRNAKMIRLDAVGYLTKKRGTRCFFNEPEIWTYLRYIREAGEANNVQLLAEVHEHYTLRLQLAEAGFWVYDFCLPMLVLSALHRSDGGPLRRWLQVCPFRQVTCLDTHDGFGVPDVEDVLTTEQIEETEASLCGCKETLQWSYSSDLQKFVKHNSAVGTTHQHNCTMYSSIQGRSNWYLLARAIQVFTPGIPMIYYVGLLAGTNDVKLAESTGSDRFLNRHYYSTEEAKEQLQRPIVKSLLKLLRFRNEYPAFLGEMSVNEALDEHLLSISWEHDKAFTTLSADLRTKEWRISFKCLNSGKTKSLEFDVDEAVPCCELSCAIPSKSCACSTPSLAVKLNDHDHEHVKQRDFA